MQIINLLINSIMQIILFTIIPFVWWLIARKQHQHPSFLFWIGIKKPVINNKKKYIFSFIVIGIISLIIFFIIPFIVGDADTASSQFAGQGISGLIPALIYSIIHTGLSEEIFFRGFLTKRLTNRFGFKVGNIIQGMLFGLVHGFLFFVAIGALKAMLIVFITGLVGALMGWINEKQSGGSIIPSWLLHSFANMASAIIVMF
ncbi:MAG TPA: CPBP family intramembrane glutamic endopeptidase [Thermoclostridium sp.]|nr:CPBP family intramembrane glutamic endopeptidase [Thermoclostridium sp.]